ncbi:MAG: hypothetical protein U0559_10840 [Anaerolineae bacterium]
MKKLHTLMMLVTVSALLLAACGGGPAAAPSGGGQAAPTAASGSSTTSKATEAPKSSQSQPSAAKPTEAPAASNNTTANDVLNLPDVTQGLSALDSYVTNFTMAFDGKENDQPKQWTWTIEEQFVKNPPAKHTIMSGTGTGTTGQNGNIEVIEVGGKTYSRFGDICGSSDSTDAPTANTGFTPSSVIGDIKAAQLLGTETINGVPTQHFAVDVAPMASLGYTNGKSEVWVAQQGSFVVKYVFEATGKDSFFGAGSANSEGTIRWTYEVKSANQPLTIEPPKDCGGAADDIPVMSDATDKSGFGAMTIYTTASAFDDVVKFYKQEMVAKGWAEKEGGMSADGFTMLTFTKDKRSASVTITFDKDKNSTSVMISVEEAK